MIWKRIVEFGFHLLYNQLAWTYDIVSWTVSLGEWRKWQLASLKFLQGPTVLEIAHGPGHMLVEMNQRGWQVSGLDLSPAMGRLAQARLKRLGLDGQVPLLRCRIPDIALKSAAFDSILSQFPTSFIFETETLSTLHRLLKPNGVLVVLPEGHLTSRGIVSRFIHWLFYITGQTVGDSNEQPDSEAEAAFWSSLKQQFAAAGFEVRFEFVCLEKSEATVIVAQKI
ncbi:MAG: class I SAM-dependent methyltransferase [Anaerolineae bacterium]